VASDELDRAMDSGELGAPPTGPHRPSSFYPRYRRLKARMLWAQPPGSSHNPSQTSALGTF